MLQFEIIIVAWLRHYAFKFHTLSKTTNATLYLGKIGRPRKIVNQKAELNVTLLYQVTAWLLESQDAIKQCMSITKNPTKE